MKKQTVNGKVIILGDLHFFIKNSNIEFYENTQLSFFRDELIPYMLKNGIDTIFQLGDLLDNRTTIDIKLWQRIKKDIFEDLIQKNNIKIITLLGNHDISYRNTLDTSFMYTISDMFPDNVELISEVQSRVINNKEYLFVPWLLEGEKIDPVRLTSANYILGHFETQDFEVTKGHYIESGLDPNEFTIPSIEKVYSGHFHIRQKKGKFEYVGTPYQLTFGDYNLKNGFVVHTIGDFTKDIFIDNKVSSKFIKLKYNDTNKKPLEISGLYARKKHVNLDSIPIKDLYNHRIKFFINEAKDSKFNDFIYVLKENGVVFEVVNNQEVSELIGTEYISNEDDIIDTKKFILESIKLNEDTKQLSSLLYDIMVEAESRE